MGLFTLTPHQCTVMWVCEQSVSLMTFIFFYQRHRRCNSPEVSVTKVDWMLTTSKVRPDVTCHRCVETNCYFRGQKSRNSIPYSPEVSERLVSFNWTWNHFTRWQLYNASHLRCSSPLAPSANVVDQAESKSITVPTARWIYRLLLETTAVRVVFYCSN